MYSISLNRIFGFIIIIITIIFMIVISIKSDFTSVKWMVEVT